MQNHSEGPIKQPQESAIQNEKGKRNSPKTS